MRGNEMQIDLSISVKVFSGKLGHIIRILDSENGFDYKTKIKQMRSGDLSYRQRNGLGLKYLDRIGFNASYEDRGRVINIIIKNLNNF